MPENKFLKMWQAIKNGDTETSEQLQKELALENATKIYNESNGTDLELVPEKDTGEIKQQDTPLYKSAYDRWTTETAKGQEVRRFVNGPLKIGLGVLGGSAVAADMARYGLIGGGLRTAGGLVGAAGASNALGYAGDYADRKLHRDYIGDTGRFVGGLFGYGAGRNYAGGVSKRLAETLVRQGDKLRRTPFNAIKDILKNKDVRRFVLGNNQLVRYSVGQYNGTTPTSVGDSGFQGDPVDIFFGRGNSPALYLKTNYEIPSPFKKYVSENYPGRRIDVYRLNKKPNKHTLDLDEWNALNAWGGLKSGNYSIKSNTGEFYNHDSRRIYDAAGHLLEFTRTPEGIKMQPMDIWKFNGKDLVKRYGDQQDQFIQKLIQIGGDWIDSEGNPFIMLDSPAYYNLKTMSVPIQDNSVRIPSQSSSVISQ